MLSSLVISHKFEGKGSLAIWRDEVPVEGTASDPNYIGGVLQQQGFNVTYLLTKDLCDSQILNKKNFDLLIIPYGASYPGAGKGPLLEFLKSGGSFFQIGGYAFDNLIEPRDWYSDPQKLYINTRVGIPGDCLALPEDRIGVFDPAYRLVNAVVAKAAPGQFIVPEGIEFMGPFEGYSACALVADNHPVFPKVKMRLIPLIQAFDELGRIRGTLGSIAYNFDGPFKGSSWAFFGVTNKDLFIPESAEMKQALVDIVEVLLRKTFLIKLSTNFDCYRQGESVEVAIQSAGNADSVKVDITPENKTEPVFSQVLHLLDGTAKTEWVPGKFEDKFYIVRATLLSDKNPKDELQTGFIVWDEDLLAKGFSLNYGKNYFRVGDQPRFLSGTNSTGFIFYSIFENPLTWERDFARMRDLGFSLLRILHFAPLMSGGQKFPRSSKDLLDLPEWLLRKLDAIVMLGQSYGVAIFLSLHDWIPVELSDEDLQFQREFCRSIAARYKDVSGILWDIQNEPSVRLSNVPHIKDLFNQYLKEKYGSHENLAAAWRVSPPTKILGDIDVDSGTDSWEDIKTFDYNQFRVEILNRWIHSNLVGIREGKSNHPVTVGYLPSMSPADKVLGCREQDFSNMHYYGRKDKFPHEFKITDRRFEGKSLSLGEFGAKVHPSWPIGVWGAMSMEDAVSWFLQVGHYTLGLGGSFMCNWDFKDMMECIFPWGLLYPCDCVPKEFALAYRSMTMLFRLLKPVYQQPSVFLLIPDCNRLGGLGDKVLNAIFNAIDLLISCHVDFNVINESDLDKLPSSVKAMFYVLPFCPEDEVFQRVMRFVEEGGVLYLSGDISYDPLRRRNRTQRLEQLCGVRFLQENYPNLEVAKENLKEVSGFGLDGFFGSPCIVVEPVEAKVLARSSDGTPFVVSTSRGRGKVLYCTEPVELRSDPLNLRLYSQFLKFAGITPNPILTDDPFIHIFKLSLMDLKTCFILFNSSNEQRMPQVKFGKNTVELTLKPKKPGLLLFDSEGDLYAVEAQGPVRVNDKPFVSSNGFFMLASLDDQPISNSNSLFLLPLDLGQFKLYTSAAKPWVAEVGEFEGGWRKLKDITVETYPEALRVSVEDDLKYTVHLISHIGKMDEAKSKMLQLFYLK